MVIIKRIFISCLFLYLGFPYLWATNNKSNPSFIKKEKSLSNNFFPKTQSLKSNNDFNNLRDQEFKKENEEPVSARTNKSTQHAQEVNTPFLEEQEFQENNISKKKKQKKSPLIISKNKDHIPLEKEISLQSNLKEKNIINSAKSESCSSSKRETSVLLPSKKQNSNEEKNIEGNKFMTLFNNISNKRKVTPYIHISDIEKIDDTDERGRSPECYKNQGGSRRWVSFFDKNETQNEEELRAWHEKTAQAIEQIYFINNKNEYIRASTNFVLARLTFVPQDPSLKREPPQEIPFFFASGWPSDRKNTIVDLTKGLAGKQFKGILEDYENYGILFVTRTYIKDNFENTLRRDFNGSHNNDLFVNEIKDVLELEVINKERLIAERRLRTSIKTLENRQTNNLLDECYFHSEQVLKRHVKKLIEERQKKYLLKHVILDFCSYKDVCWRCGDTLFCCCHNQDFGVKVFINASGCVEYKDFKSQEALRHKRHRFSGYYERKSYEIEPYKPYISHATTLDIKNYHKEEITNFHSSKNLKELKERL